jgi:hypothetical protein
MAATAHPTVVAPDNEKFTVLPAPARLPRRKPNAEYRSREHLTEREVGRLIEVVRGNRWGHRDATMEGRPVPMHVGHAGDQVDLEHALLHVRRLKNGSPATHPLTGKELRALRRLQREQDTKSPFVCTSERGTPFTKRGFQAMWPTTARIPGRSRPISATSRSSTRFVIPSWRQDVSKAFCKTELLRISRKRGPFFANDKGDPTPCPNRRWGKEAVRQTTRSILHRHPRGPQCVPVLFGGPLLITRPLLFCTPCYLFPHFHLFWHPYFCGCPVPLSARTDRGDCRFGPATIV